MPVNAGTVVRQRELMDSPSDGGAEDVQSGGGATTAPPPPPPPTPQAWQPGTLGPTGPTWDIPFIPPIVLVPVVPPTPPPVVETAVNIPIPPEVYRPAPLVPTVPPPTPPPVTTTTTPPPVTTLGPTTTTTPPVTTTTPPPTTATPPVTTLGPTTTPVTIANETDGQEYTLPAWLVEMFGGNTPAGNATIADFYGPANLIPTPNAATPGLTPPTLADLADPLHVNTTVTGGGATSGAGTTAPGAAMGAPASRIEWGGILAAAAIGLALTWLLGGRKNV